jgi:hypothetical protein
LREEWWREWRVVREEGHRGGTQGSESAKERREAGEGDVLVVEVENE